MPHTPVICFETYNTRMNEYIMDALKLQNFHAQILSGDDFTHEQKVAIDKIMGKHRVASHPIKTAKDIDYTIKKIIKASDKLQDQFNQQRNEQRVDHG